MGDIRGRSVKMSHGGSVFVGRAGGSDDSYYLSFTNESDDITRIKLSAEAAAALHGLLLVDGGDEVPPAKLEWRLVVDADLPQKEPKNG